MRYVLSGNTIRDTIQDTIRDTVDVETSPCNAEIVARLNEEDRVYMVNGRIYLQQDTALLFGNDPLRYKYTQISKKSVTLLSGSKHKLIIYGAPYMRTLIEEVKLDLVNQVRLLASTYPYVLANSCSYFQGKAGPGEGCLIGQAAQRLSPESRLRLTVLVDLVANATDTITNFWFSSPWLALVQQYQDNEKNWQNAVKLADAVK